MNSPFKINSNNGIFTVTRQVTSDEIIAKAREILAARVLGSHELTSSRHVRDYLATELAGLEHEVFGAIFMDNHHRVICCRKIFTGTLNGCAVYPREIVKEALKHNAAAVILFHNHPSGVAEPSRADELLTTRLKEVLGQIDVRVLDHLVIGGAEAVSFSERGLL